VEHFVCSQCSQPLGGRRYVLRDGRPTCVRCFHALLADYCDACGRIVAVSERHVTLDGRTWHATPTCFRCARCGRSLLGKPLVRAADADAGNGVLFCSLDCCRRDLKRSTCDVTRPDRARRRSVVKNRRKSLGDLDCRLPLETCRTPREWADCLRETSL